MGTAQRDADTVVLPGVCPSRSVVEVSENPRVKVYSLFCRLGYIDLPGITVEDHVTLTVIERYLDFKVGEVWSEIQSELELESIRPISPDMEAMEWIGRCMEEEAIQVAHTQIELFEAQYQQDVNDEQENYMEIRENHKQKEKTINDFDEFVARTSNYDKLRQSKEKQQASIEASRIMTKYKESDNFHDADIPNIQTTVFSNRIVTMESTPTEIFGGHLEATQRFSVPRAKRGGPVGSPFGDRTGTTWETSVGGNSTQNLYEQPISTDPKDLILSFVH